MIIEKIEKHKIIPILALENAENIVPICEALEAGGIQVAEITFRTASAPEAIRIATKEFPEFIIGAGTVLKLEDVDTAKNAGAVFAVSPGLNPMVVRHAQQIGLPFFPGVCTPTDIETAIDNGCKVMKFFPAGAMGGIKMIKAIYAPLSHLEIRFIPTGGVNAENMVEYLSHPAILAVGGSWIVPKKLIAEKNWQKITGLAQQAVNYLATL